MTDRVAQLKQMLEAEPGDPFCLYALGQEFARQGHTEEAIRHYDLAIAADPHASHAFYHKAKALSDADRNREAIDTLRLGLACARRSGDSHAAAEIEAFLDELAP